jgi:hypothetical protein
MYKGVSDFLKSNSILAGKQFGFRKNLSTKKSIFRFTEEILGALNNKCVVVEYVVILLKHVTV